MFEEIKEEDEEDNEDEEEKKEGKMNRSPSPNKLNYLSANIDSYKYKGPKADVRYT